MAPEIDEKSREVRFSLSKKLYSEESLVQAANAFQNQSEAFLDEADDRFEVTLAARSDIRHDDLRRLGGEFLNEVLSVERRLDVFKQDRKIIEMTVSQALLSAQQSPEQEKEAARLEREAAPEAEKLMAEIRKAG